MSSVDVHPCAFSSGWWGGGRFLGGMMQYSSSNLRMRQTPPVSPVYESLHGNMWWSVWKRDKNRLKKKKAYLSGLAACGFACQPGVHTVIIVLLIFGLLGTNWIWIMVLIPLCFSDTSELLYFRVRSVLPPLVALVLVPSFFFILFCLLFQSIPVSHPKQRWCALSLPLSLHYWSEQSMQTQPHGGSAHMLWIGSPPPSADH